MWIIYGYSPKKKTNKTTLNTALLTGVQKKYFKYLNWVLKQYQVSKNQLPMYPCI